MAKSEKSAPVETEAPAKPKSKRLLLAVVAVLILGLAGGAAWYFIKSRPHAEEPKAVVVAPPAFMALEPFTVNLQREENDQFLQIGITLKISSAALEEKIKERLPEVRSRLLFLLSSKRASELMPVEGKKKLAQEIVVATNTVLGLHTAPQKNVAHESNAAPSPDTAPGAETTAASGVDVPAASAPPEAAAHGDATNNNGVLDVLFTSFIIQ